MYAQSMWFDIDHVVDALGWAPRWSTDEMFAQSYDWFLANRGRIGDRRVAPSAPGEGGRAGAAQARHALLPQSRT